MQAEASKLARMIAADDITSTAALLNCIGKVGFLRQIQLGTKESSREKDILFCSELLDGLSAEEATMQRHYEYAWRIDIQDGRSAEPAVRMLI